jgi:hypothetical protein
MTRIDNRMSPNAFPNELNTASYTLRLLAVFITNKTAGPGLNAALKEMIKNVNQLEKFIIEKPDRRIY